MSRLPSMRWLLALVLIGACASDPVEAAANCTELEQVRDTELEKVDTLDEHHAIEERVAEKARELRGEASARGADFEAALCIILEAERVVFETFEDIGEGLDTTTP